MIKTGNFGAVSSRLWRDKRPFFISVILFLTEPSFPCSFTPLQINELKKVHQAGGRSTPTWLKQPGDKGVFMFGLALMTVGFAQLIPAYYRLATGKGKLE